MPLPLSLIILLPLAGFLINGLIGQRLPRPLAGVIGSLAVLGAFVVAVLNFLQLHASPEEERRLIEQVYTWISVGSLEVDVSFLMDQLSGVMILIVTGIGFLIHVYSMGYMGHDHNDPQGTRYARYFAFLNLFIAFMALLVLADNYLLMFVGWEGVGLCSYFLIGHWFQLKDAAEASKKAFIVNRIGDFGFLLGMMLIFLAVGSLDYGDVFNAARNTSGAFEVGTLGALGGITLITLLLVVGATGKSAQIPLFVWLPDAMAGPTPVSALIHAATMVTAGVYMMARSSALFDLAPDTQLIVCGIGAVTALAAGLTALAHTDIKKVLAYSTVSQLGFMFMGIGAGAYVAAIFHVFTHAFFKACLFLGAGSVIHALHGEQDMRRMGGLAAKMKVTHITFLLAGLALAGFFPFSGYSSKDEIIAEVFRVGGTNSTYMIFGVIALVTAFITALYTGRQYAQIFLGQPRYQDVPAGEPHGAHGELGVQGAHELPDASSQVEEPAASHAVTDVHEAPATMTIPLVILAIGAVFAGLLGLPHLSFIPENLRSVAHWFTEWLSPVFTAGAEDAHGAAHEPNMILLAIGALIGWVGWIVGRSLGTNAGRALLPASTNWLSLDALYNRTVVQGGFGLAAALRWIDANIVDGIVNGIAALIGQISNSLRLTQTSFVRNYALAMTLGAVIVLAYFIVR